MSNRLAKITKKILPAREIFFFCSQMADLLDAGIPLDDGLDAMLTETSGGDNRAALEAIRDRLEDQEPLSQAMQMSGLFPPYAVRMAESGERTGQSDVVMRELARYYEQEAELRVVLTNAVVYPLTMTAIMLAVLFLLAFWVMPVFEGVFMQLGAAFSPATQAVVNGAAIVSGVGLVLLAVGTLTFFVLRLTGKTTKLAELRLWRAISSRSKLFLRIGEGRFAGTIALALRSGLTFDQGIDLARPIVGSGVVQNKIDVCREQLDDGKSFVEAVKAAGLFTGLQRQRLQIGIRTGKFDTTMSQISQSCAEEATLLAGQLLARLEPALTAAMSLIAGGILVLVMLPLLGILSSIG